MTSESGEYSIRFAPFGPTIRGVTVFDENGFANIYINAHLSCSERERAIKHELRHVRHDDAYRGVEIERVEDEAECKTIERREPEVLSPQKLRLVINAINTLDAFLSESDEFGMWQTRR